MDAKLIRHSKNVSVKIIEAIEKKDTLSVERFYLILSLFRTFIDYRDREILTILVPFYTLLIKTSVPKAADEKIMLFLNDLYEMSEKNVDHEKRKELFPYYLLRFSNILELKEIPMYEAANEEILSYWPGPASSGLWLYLHLTMASISKKKMSRQTGIIILMNLDSLIICPICRNHYIQLKPAIQYDIFNGVHLLKISIKLHNYISYLIQHDHNISLPKLIKSDENEIIADTQRFFDFYSKNIVVDKDVDKY